jgi:hypothetical protein
MSGFHRKVEAGAKDRQIRGRFTEWDEGGGKRGIFTANRRNFLGEMGRKLVR